MTDKLRDLLEDVRTVYEGKGMVVYPNSFDRLRTEIIKLDNVNKQQVEQIEKLEEENAELRKKKLDAQDAVTMQMYTNKANKEIADKQLAKAKDIIERLLINRPDTYSGNYIELIQSKMFQFNQAVSDADDFISSEG